MASCCCGAPPLITLTVHHETKSGVAYKWWCGFDTFVPTTPKKRFAKRHSYGETVTNRSAEYRFVTHVDDYRSEVLSSERKFNQAVFEISEKLTPTSIDGCETSQSSRGTDVTSHRVRTYTVVDLQPNPGPTVTCECVYDYVVVDGVVVTQTEVCERDIDGAYCITPLLDLCISSSLYYAPDEITENKKTINKRIITYHASSHPFCIGTSGSEVTQNIDELEDEVPPPDHVALRDDAIANLSPSSGGASAEFTITTSIFSDSERVDAMVQSSKVSLVHEATPTCYLKVWLEKRFWPKGVVDFIDTEVVEAWEYEWEETGNPCLNDKDLSVNSEENKIQSPTYDLDVPNQEGSVTLWIKKYSAVKGYEPDDPDAEGLRPIPDNNPNGYPKLT